MKKILITGAEGFVGKHFIDFHKDDDSIKIIGIDIANKSRIFQDNYMYYRIDLQNDIEIGELIKEQKPDVLIHLAAFSSVGKSWIEPGLCFKNNTDIFVNILESVKINCLKCRILSVGSSEEYGIVDAHDIPVNESIQLKPNSPYAVARVSQEMLSKIYVEGYGLDIVLTRSFNHIGPGQNTNFAIPAFVNRILNANDSISVGNLTAIRDFTDVRDVVRAYKLLLEKGKAGETYNVCSGIGYQLSEIVDIIKEITEKTHVKNIVDTKLLRPIDLPKMIGDNSKLKETTNWVPEITLDNSINDIVDYFKRKEL